MPQSAINIINLAGALRLPFITVSIIAFSFGSIIVLPAFKPGLFFLGLLCVISTHLGANLINDYADSKSGVDWQDTQSYGFFGGSKFIQNKIFSESFFLKLSLLMFGIAFCLSLVLSLQMKNFTAVAGFCAVAILGWGYSVRPLQFVYHKWGEVVLFLLFGQALVMGGYFIQTGIFPDIKSFMLSLPFGFATTAVLFANEIPDFTQDKAKGKITWVDFLGVEKSFLVYLALVAMMLLSIVFNVYKKNLSIFSLLALLCFIPATKAASVLKNHYDDKLKCIVSSRLTIAIYNLMGLVLIADMII